jgi:hypothetical protein
MIMYIEFLYSSWQEIFKHTLSVVRVKEYGVMTAVFL